MAFQLFSSPTISFNSLFARVWQFLAGGFAHEVIQLFSYRMDVFQLSENGKCLSLRCMKSTKYHQLDTDEVNRDMKGNTAILFRMPIPI